MINHVNHLVLIGTLAENAKISETKEKQPMAILTVVTSSEWMQDGQKKKQALWNKVFFFGDDALIRADYKKGMVVQITAEVGERPIMENKKAIYKTIVVGKTSWVMELGSSHRPLPEIIS